MIIFLILIDFAHDSLKISFGENWFWALLGLKGLRSKVIKWKQFMKNKIRHIDIDINPVQILKLLTVKPGTRQPWSLQYRLDYSVLFLDQQTSQMLESTEEKSPYSPLPNDTIAPGDHKGTFGRCRYIYFGKHSEGNRFIQNDQLWNATKNLRVFILWGSAEQRM